MKKSELSEIQLLEKTLNDNRQKTVGSILSISVLISLLKDIDELSSSDKVRLVASLQTGDYSQLPDIFDNEIEET